MLLLLFLSPVFGPVAEAQQIACPQRGIEQITDEPSGNSEKPSVSGNGKYVAFESRADFRDVLLYFVIQPNFAGGYRPIQENVAHRLGRR